jgi:hypothetical protein
LRLERGDAECRLQERETGVVALGRIKLIEDPPRAGEPFISVAVAAPAFGPALKELVHAPDCAPTKTNSCHVSKRNGASSDASGAD